MLILKQNNLFSIEFVNATKKKKNGYIYSGTCSNSITQLFYGKNRLYLQSSYLAIILGQVLIYQEEISYAYI